MPKYSSLDFVCRQCGEDNPEDFYVSNKTLCKECVKDRVKKRAAENADQIAEYERKRAKDPKRQQAHRDYMKTEKGKAAAKKARQKYIANNAEKRAAHIIVGNAVRDGKLNKESCKCGRTDVHAHHDDYSKPLEVKWLCPQCHKDYHKEQDK